MAYFTKRVGIIVENLLASELNYYLVEWFNKQREYDCVFFFKEPTRIDIKPKTAAMPLVEGFSFTGDVLITCQLDNRLDLIFPSAESRNLYLWDYLWARENNPSFRKNQKFYTDSFDKIVVRSKDLGEALEKNWAVKHQGIVEDANVKEILAKA